MSGGGTYRSIVALLVVIGALGLAPVAVANPVSATRSTGGDLLPFSGIDLAFAVLVGGCLVLLGAGLSRLSARRPRD